MQGYDMDKTHTTESDKTYSMAFVKRQAKAAGGLTKRGKTPPQVETSEPGISLEGRRLDRDFVTNKENQPQKKPRKADGHKGNLLPPPKLRSGPLDYEAGVQRRPSIERGGTNTIEMEVSGVGSRGSSRENETSDVAVREPPPPSQPLGAKEGIVGSRKRQKHSPAAEDTDGALVGQLSPQHGSSKPPVPPSSMERSANSSLSAPIKNVQKKSKKSRQYSYQASRHESGYGTAGDETPSRRSSTATTDMDSSMNGGGVGVGAGSPSESQLIELQPFANPEFGLRESVTKIASEDWSAKCDGMIGVRQVAMFHPAVLQPQLRSVVLAVQKEVGLVWENNKSLVYLLTGIERS